MLVFFHCCDNFHSIKFLFYILECNKASTARLRADQMEAKESVAKDHDKMEWISHKNGIVAIVIEENRGEFWHRCCRLFPLPTMAHGPQPTDFHHHIHVYHFTSTRTHRTKGSAMQLYSPTHNRRLQRDHMGLSKHHGAVLSWILFKWDQA